MPRRLAARGRHQILRAARVVPDKEQVEIGPVLNSAAANFPSADNRYIFAAQQFVS